MNKMLITNAGLAEIVNAEQSGTAPVVLSHVAFGTGQYTATANLTKLKSEFKRFDAVAGGAISDNMIHLTVHDNSADKYTVNEVGVFTASGTLFAVISQTTPIMEKSATSESMLAIDIALTDIDASSISFGETNIILNPATTAAAGIVELATDAEAKTGTDTTRAITPAALDATIESHDNIVHKSGAEAIPGYKCFTGDVGKRNNNADVSTVPANNTYSSFDFSDKNNKKYASVVGATYTDGDVGAILAANRTINGVEYHSQIHVRLDEDGTPYATAPTPAAGDNSTKIATTQWANAKFLSLAGGTMTGAIKRAGVFATGTTTDAVVSLHGGTASLDGAGIWLYGKDNTNAGKFLLRSADANGNVDLVGYPNGGLSWNGKNIVRSVNGNAADAAGNVEMPVGIENTATGTDSLNILGTASANSNATSIGIGAGAGATCVAVGTNSYAADNGCAMGYNARTGGYNTVVIGANAKVQGINAVGIGCNATANGNYSVALGQQASTPNQYSMAFGYKAITSADYAIQVGQGTNSTAKTMQVWNYTLLDKDTGKIPSERITGFLPTSGGTMTGTLDISNPDAGDGHKGFLYKQSGGALSLGIRTSTNEALQNYLQFATNGNVAITASDGTNSKSLLMKPDGTLTWGGENVLVPAGILAPFAGTTAPSGWLVCDGSAISRTKYAKLFAAIGTKYGGGDGSTTFNLPTQSVLPLGTTAPVVTSDAMQTISNRPALRWGRCSDGYSDMDNGGTVALYSNGNTYYSGQNQGGGDYGQIVPKNLYADITNATGATAIVCIKY